MKNITILEPTQVPDEIYQFLSHDTYPPDFYGKIEPDIYFYHGDQGCECFIRFFRVIDGCIWFPCGSNFPDALDKLGHEISQFLHAEEDEVVMP